MSDFHDVSRYYCQCGHVILSVQNLTGVNAPKPGDKNICIECGSVAIYDDRLRLREPTPQEYARLANDSRLHGFRRQRKTIKRNWQRRREGKR